MKEEQSKTYARIGVAYSFRGGAIWILILRLPFFQPTALINPFH
jgi:hypothetical protein